MYIFLVICFLVFLIFFYYMQANSFSTLFGFRLKTDLPGNQHGCFDLHMAELLVHGIFPPRRGKGHYVTSIYKTDTLPPTPCGTSRVSWQVSRQQNIYQIHNKYTTPPPLWYCGVSWQVSTWRGIKGERYCAPQPMGGGGDRHLGSRYHI